MKHNNEFLLSTMLYNYLENDLTSYRINITMIVNKIMKNEININDVQFVLSFIIWGKQ
jgi:hypothetical protein